MLAEIQKQLAINEVMTEKQLVKQLKTNAAALTPMMRLLIKRGLVEKITSGNCAGSCGCVNAAVYAYRWLGNAQKTTPLNISFN